MTAPVLDAHTHAFPDALAPSAMKVLIAEAKWMPVQAHHDGTVGGLVASMDRAGIRRAIMCSVATRPGQVRKITDWSAQVASARIIPFASIHPDFETPEAEAERIAGLGIKGLKFHPQYMHCALDDPRSIRIAKAAAAAGLALTCHAGYDLAYDLDDLAHPRRMRALHEAVPGLRLLACHLGGWRCWEEVLTHVAGLPIYLETSYVFGQCPAELMARILARHAPEFLLFGSDAPWADQASELAHFQRLALPPEVKRRALWENAHRYVGVEAPPEAATG